MIGKEAGTGWYKLQKPSTYTSILFRRYFYPKNGGQINTNLENRIRLRLFPFAANSSSTPDFQKKRETWAKIGKETRDSNSGSPPSLASLSVALSRPP